MKLHQVLNTHNEFSPSEGLKQSLGDNYLIKNNSLFYAIRTKTLKLGFRFSDAFNPFYLALPMSQLEIILSTKSIPFSDNTSALNKLNQQTNKGLDWDHVVDNLKSNYVFHESCHALARNTALNINFNNLEPRNKILSILIEESFANTCEFLLIADADDSIHRLFLEKNSYFTVFEDRTHLKKAISKYSLASLFRFMFFSYLQSNFLHEQLTDTDFNKIIELSEFKEVPEKKVLKSLARNAFALNPRFRQTTTEMYLRMSGLPLKVREALNFDGLSLIASNSELKRLISELTLVITL